MEYDSTADTLAHIRKVSNLLGFFAQKIIDRAIQHDSSKLAGIEKETFDKITPLLRDVTYGSDEYIKIMRDNISGIKHHQKCNSHHPEFHEKGVNDMTLVDIVEMFLDWKASSERHKTGDIFKSIEIQKERFGISKQLCQIFRNTARILFEPHKP